MVRTVSFVPPHKCIRPPTPGRKTCTARSETKAGSKGKPDDLAPALLILVPSLLCLSVQSRPRSATLHLLIVLCFRCVFERASKNHLESVQRIDKYTRRPQDSQLMTTTNTTTTTSTTTSTTTHSTGVSTTTAYAAAVLALTVAACAGSARDPHYCCDICRKACVCGQCPKLPLV